MGFRDCHHPIGTPVTELPVFRPSDATPHLKANLASSFELDIGRALIS